MSTTPPKAEGRRRPVSVVQIKLWEMMEALEQRLDNPTDVLEILVTAVAKGEEPSEAFQKLHEAAIRYDKVSDVAFAYEQIASEKRIKLLPPEQQAYIYLQAAHFFAEPFGDADGAIGYAERATQAVPGHAEAFALLERLLSTSDKATRLAQLYVDASARENDAAQRINLLKRASQIVQDAPGGDELGLEIGLRILRLDPSMSDVRASVVQRLISRGRHKDVVDLLESALKREPPPPADEALLLSEWLVDLCLTQLKDPARALSHIETLLLSHPTHEVALSAAESLLDNRTVSLRAAAALSDAYEHAGRMDRAISMLTFELKQVRGPRRVEVQRRLGILRQDVLNDPAGALELLAPVVAGDPGDDDLRSRFISLSLGLNQPEQAARLLSRALQTSRDPAVRARVGADVGHVFLKSGDVRRAQSAFQQVIEAGQDDLATLEAARQLAELYAESGELKQLLNVLELVVRLEPEKELRQAAARRLARLCDGEGGDPARAIVAWRALIGSPWTDEALRRLEALYGAAGDEEGLADVLLFRADRSRDPVEAQRLAFHSAELRSAHTRDPEAALNAWRKLIERFGPAREIHARMAPLLEQVQRWDELVKVLAAEEELAEGNERLALLVKTAQIQQTHLRDPEAALEAYRQALAIDATDRVSRAAVEKLLGSGNLRLKAGEVLEPIYRREEPSVGLVRLLETRAELETEPVARLAALDEAVRIAEHNLRNLERALELSGRALVETVAHQRDALPGALYRFLTLAQSVGDPARRARHLQKALSDRAVDSGAMLELARATADALAAAGEISRAVDVYRQALSFDPSSRELMEKVDELLTQQGAPEERLQLYRAALDQEQDPQRRRELLHSMAALQRRELHDLQGAIESFRAALRDDPRDVAAHQALTEALAEAEDFPGVYAELERTLSLAEGERRNVTLLRMAEVAGKIGDTAAALDHYRTLLETSELGDEVFDAIEQLALQQNDGATIRTIIERRLAVATDSAEMASLLERLGNAYALQLDDREKGLACWLEGARMSEVAAQDPIRARRLYERVLELDPDQREAAERLIEIGAKASDWELVKKAFQSALRTMDERELVMLLLGLEEQAYEDKNVDDFVSLVDLALARNMQPLRARHVLLAKARALGSAPATHGAAARIFRQLLENAGDDAHADVEAFETFLSHTELTPERVDDYRWLYRFKAQHAADPASVIEAWAHAEETRFHSAVAAIELYRRLLELDPERTDALSELARLQGEQGDAEGALRSLEQLASKADPESRPAIELSMASLLIGPLARPGQALDFAASVLAHNQSDADALRIVHQALNAPEARARAALLLEQVAEASDDPNARADVIEALLAVSADAPELAAARTRWLLQLLDTKSENPEEALRLALRGAEAAPGEARLWDFAEQMARKLDTPAPVAEAYARTIERTLPPEVADTLGRRMVEFHEEWFDEPDRVIHLLDRVLRLSPSAGWAFDRLKLAFNAAGRWPELFSLYDARLASGIREDEQIDLLREAAMAARDFASDPERATAYLERLNRLAPGDTRVESSLERLYERHGRKRPLIDLLSARLVNVAPHERAELSGRIAALWLDLDEPVPAFALAGKLLETAEDSREPVALLERIVAMPDAEHARVDSDAASTVRKLAARHLKAHYRRAGSLIDVVRMLHVEAESAAIPQRIEVLKEIVELSLAELGDLNGAFETLAVLIGLEPASSLYRKQFAELAHALSLQERRAEALVGVAQKETRAAIRADLFNEAGDVYRENLDGPSTAADLYRRVLSLSNDAPEVALHAARELSQMLRGGEAPAEHADVLEQLAALESDDDARRAALGEAAEIALSTLADPERAVRAFRKRLALGTRDPVAIDGLCRALEQAGRWDELIAALGARANLTEDDEKARADRVRIAEIHASIKHDRRSAIDAWRAVREHHGKSRDSFKALFELLEAEGDHSEVAALLEQEVQDESDAARRAELNQELGTVHQLRTFDMLRALEAFVAAGNWEKAIEVAGANHAQQRLAERICERLLELAVEKWSESDSDAPARAADWAVSELSTRLLEQGKYPIVVQRLLQASKLPFPTARQRELRRDAACLCSDRLGDSEQAITLFKALLDEDPADDVARSSVTRLAVLLEEHGRTEDIVALWEQQARARAESGDAPGAAVLWARAGELAEQRIGDMERALRCYEQGAALHGEASLEALARIHTARGDHRSAISALEALCAQSSPDVLSERALRLSSAFIACGDPEGARSCLEAVVNTAVQADAIRSRLAELYREAKDYEALAALLAEEAARTLDRRQKLGLLTEAARLHLEERRDPEAAVPLMSQAIELDPDDQKLRLKLAQALYAATRYGEAIAALEEQIIRYGSRRPKDRALAHFQLAKTLLAADRQAEALTELDAASKIDPAHPGIMQMLAKVAFEQGELDRAERMYRALLLVVARDDDPEAPTKAEALISLSEIAARKGEAIRASEFIESAFESALESSRDAAALEQALRARGRHDLLIKILESRLSQDLGVEEAARTLSDLVMIHAESLGDLRSVKPDLARRAKSLHKQLESEKNLDDSAWAALGRIYDHLGDSEAEAQILERRVVLQRRSNRPSADPDLFYRLAKVRLASPETATQGIEFLEHALDLAPDFARAQSLLGAEAIEALGRSRVANLLERIARATNDAHALADALAMQIGLPGFGLERLQEAVTIAKDLGDSALAERMLVAAQDSASDEFSDEARAWLLVELAELSQANGDTHKARELRERAANYLPASEAYAIRLELARQWAEVPDEWQRAAEMYETLLQSNPSERDVWAPLLALYQEHGQEERRLSLVDKVISVVEDRSERSALRLAQVRAFYADPNRTEEVIALLKDILEDDPSEREAARLLSELLEREGRSDELRELLVREIDRAKDDRDVPAIVHFTLRLERLLEDANLHSEALDFSRAALEWAPRDPELLHTVIRLSESTSDSETLADALEALLQVITGEEAVQHARRLAALCEERGDEEGALRALTLGFNANPRDPALRDRLLERYTQKQDFEKVAELLNAALRDKPGDAALLTRLVETYHALGQPEAALRAIDELLVVEQNVDLYRMRAAVLTELGRDSEAVEALEQAIGSDPSLAADLEQALERSLARAEPEQAAALIVRLVEVMENAGNLAAARVRLAEYVEKTPDDLNALRRLAVLESRAGSASSAIKTLQRLADIEEGPALIETALRLSDVCELAGTPEQAQVALQRALELDRTHVELRQRLATIYEANGQNRALAELMLEDANSQTDPAIRLSFLLRAGQLLMGQDGDVTRAVQVLETARAESPDSVDAVVLLSQAYISDERADVALSLLTSVADAHRGKRVKALSVVHEQIAEIHLADGFLTDALASLSKAFELDPKNSRLAMRLGQLAIESEEDDVAQRAFRAVAIMKPLSPDHTEGASSEVKADANYYLAVLARKLGDPRKAKVLLSKALAERPEHVLARELLQELDVR